MAEEDAHELEPPAPEAEALLLEAKGKRPEVLAGSAPPSRQGSDAQEKLMEQNHSPTGHRGHAASDPPPMRSSPSSGEDPDRVSEIVSEASSDQEQSNPTLLVAGDEGSSSGAVTSRSHIGEIEREMKDELYRQLEKLVDQEMIHYRVPEITRSLDKDAYAPQVVSFGPYHRDNEALSSADKYKWLFLQQILIMNKEVTLERCLEEMDRMKQKAKGCYEEDIQMETNDGIKMLLLDGCCILGFLGILPLPPQEVGAQTQTQDNLVAEASTDQKFMSRVTKMAASHLPSIPVREFMSRVTKMAASHLPSKGNRVVANPLQPLTICIPNNVDQMAVITLQSQREAGDQTHQEQDKLWHRDSIRHDLLLMENQLPFFVLQKIYELATAGTPVEEGSLEDKVDRTIQKLLASYPLMTTKQRFQHLLHCCHLKFRPAVDNSSSSNSKPTDELQQWRGATDLYKAGIKFKPKLRDHDHDHDHSLLDVQLVSRRTLMIPTLIIEDSTSSVFRNLIAFEQSCTNENYFAAYAFFMGELMRTPEDVSLLVKKGVVKNYIGADKEVSDFFKSLVKRVVLGVNGKHFLSSMFKELNSYYNSVGHKYVADLKQNYFGSPWLVISVAAAAIVLVCTVVQTVYTVMGYYRM